MAKQDDWVRLQVRLPKDLHEGLRNASKGSLNAQIVDRLARSLMQDKLGALRGAEATFRLDASGRPISWEEINMHVDRIRNALEGEPITQINIDVSTTEIEAARAAQREMFLQSMEWFYASEGADKDEV